MGPPHATGGGRHAVAMVATRDVFAHGAPSGFLHRNALVLGPLPQGRLLVLGET